MRVLKVSQKIIPKPKNSFTKERRVPSLVLSGNWLVTEIGVQPGDKVQIKPMAGNPNAVIVERVLL